MRFRPIFGAGKGNTHKTGFWGISLDFCLRQKSEQVWSPLFFYYKMNRVSLLLKIENGAFSLSCFVKWRKSTKNLVAETQKHFFNLLIFRVFPWLINERRKNYVLDVEKELTIKLYVHIIVVTFMCHLLANKIRQLNSNPTVGHYGQ